MNLLAYEQSPYLRQHADNPVEWHPWGEAAFARARKENKPIFLSVGYSTCHWCHVMARESFADAGIAKILNDSFISVKVDREERPDVDRVYMAFVQATTGQGGWPMSAWLTPDLKPFYGGTYFPPQDRYGRPGFSTLLKRIADLWGSERETIIKHSGTSMEQLSHGFSGDGGGQAALPLAQALDRGAASFEAQFDKVDGGFGGAPKFPRPSVLNFLLRYGAWKTDKAATEMGLFTLDRMANGGMRDHLGGGFHRYSVDAHWHVPHFEKMLYDQAQLACSYLDAYQLTRIHRYASVARSILDYVRRDLTAPSGGFYAAEDADSSVDGNPSAHAEGAFYVWTHAEIEQILGKDADFFISHYGVLPEGNAPAGSDPQQEFIGKNILIERKPASKKEEARLTTCSLKLFARRQRRPRPHLDEKIITAWNGLMISAFARGGRILNESIYTITAARAADFLFERLYDAEKGRLRRSFCGEPAAVEGFADDYAFLIAGLLDLFEADGASRWLERALALQRTMDAVFWDGVHGGYFSTSGEDASILIRSREEYDGAEPAAGSVAVSNLIRLAELLDEPALREKAEQTVRAAAPAMARMPTAVPQILAASMALLQPPQHLVIVGQRGAPDTDALWKEANRHYMPRTSVLWIEPGRLPPQLDKGFLKELGLTKGRASAYYCENFACRLPVTDPEELGRLLSSVISATVSRKRGSSPGAASGR